MAVRFHERTMARCRVTNQPNETEADNGPATSVLLVVNHRNLAKAGKHIDVALQLTEQAMRCSTLSTASHYATIPTTS